MRTMLKSKIHRATVTGADINYEGSITLDPALMDAADILPYEQVQVLDINNGSRLTTYAIEGAPGSGDVVINGRCRTPGQRGRHRHILTYTDLPENEARSHQPNRVYVDDHNKDRPSPPARSQREGGNVASEPYHSQSADHPRSIGVICIEKGARKAMAKVQFESAMRQQLGLTW